MILKELLSAIDYTEIVNRSGISIDKTEISSLSSYSDNATENSLFVCISGSVTDGHGYAPEAYKRSCRVFVAERKIELPDDALIIIVNNSRVALAKLSAAFFGYPASKMTMIGITGTKGKTTSSLLIYNVLKQNGIKAGYIGSNGISYNETKEETLNTTPESYFLHESLKKMYDEGVTTVVMEVSSQALKMARVHGIKFDIGVFTNLSPDHIGEFEHPDFNDYKACKHSLFTDYGVEYMVYNADDEYAPDMISGSYAEKVGISGSMAKRADYNADNICYFRTASKIAVSFDCVEESSKYGVEISFPGDFSVYNALTAIAVCKRLGLNTKQITDALKSVRIEGRFETYALPNGATAVIDYAHNGISLKAALTALREYSPTRLICLFGSVGGRTKMRRAELGLVASRDADFCILTSDNPDSESPAAIIAEIASYFTAGSCPYVAITDRKEAIEHALSISQTGDIILLAGKGHETYQLICGVRESFSEAEIIKEYCRSFEKISN